MSSALCPESRFICDDHLGRLARYLRAGGFDTAYEKDMNDSRLIQVALDEDRQILTRDRRMIERILVRDVFLLTTDLWPEQIWQVMQHFGLRYSRERMFTRCLEDNALTLAVAKETIKARIFPYTYSHHDDYRFCPACRRIYWSGTHVTAMIARLRRHGIVVTQA